MIAITEAAREFMDTFRSHGTELSWYVLIHWRKGDMENFRAPDGGAIWERGPDPGWSAEFGGYQPGKIPDNVTIELVPGIRAYVESRDPPFPGGTLDMENGKLVVRPGNAV